MRIYWANGLFTEAQREFNRRWAGELHAAGHDVILPQDFAINDPDTDPSAIDIFLIDTARVLDSDLVVAIIDDESIDAGVASEIGIAYAAGIPIVGVYTDIRQYRRIGAMYKNLYVIGLIDASFGTVASRAELLERVALVERTMVQRATGARTFPSQLDFDDLVGRLERRYDPSWSSCGEVAEYVATGGYSTVVDIGCGTAMLAEALTAVDTYIGYDVSRESIERATDKAIGERFNRVLLTTDTAAVLEAVQQIDLSRTLLVASFVLHDVMDLDTLASLVNGLTGARLLVQDLAPGDLPRLTRLLCRAAGKPAEPGEHDTRLGPARLEQVRAALGFEVLSHNVVSLACVFGRHEDVTEYCDAFGLFEGRDLPLGGYLSPDELRGSLDRVLSEEAFPLVDSRLFSIIEGVVT